MSFRKHRPYRKAVRVGPTPRMESWYPFEVPEGARDSLLRIVHTQRARKLRRRGVILEKIEDGCYAWFESGVSYLNRRMQRDIPAALRKAARMGSLLYTDDGFVRLRGMVPELAAGYGADAMARRLHISRAPGDTDAELRQRVKAYPGFMGTLYGSDESAFANVIHHNLTQNPDPVCDTPGCPNIVESGETKCGNCLDRL